LSFRRNNAGKAAAFTGRKAAYLHLGASKSHRWIVVSIMGLFKADFYRFFALGFAGGALLVFGVIDLDQRPSLADSVVPAAEAAPAR
jgi:hypothetical protein